MTKLIINYNSDKERVVDLTGFPCTIGRSPENDVSIEDSSVSNFHLRIEKEDNYFLAVDLNAESRTFFKGRPIKEKRLVHGDVLCLGRVNVLFEISLEQHGAPDEKFLSQRIDRKGIVSNGEALCPNCGYFIGSGKSFCPKCGYRSGGLPSTDLYIQPVEKGVAPGAGLLPFLSFVFSLFGPFILGLGWLLGIVLGFAALSIIRKRGGFVRDRRMALGGIIIGIIWFVVISVAGVWYFYNFKTNALIAANEKQAVMALKNIAVAEQIAKSAYCFDEDSNGVPEYASMEDLEQIQVPLLDKKVLQVK